MAPHAGPAQRRRAQPPRRRFRCGCAPARGALVATALCGWAARASSTFSARGIRLCGGQGFQLGSGATWALRGVAGSRIGRHARKPGEAPGGASVTEGGLGGQRAPAKVSGVTPVVDDSDFGLEDSGAGAGGKGQKESFDTLMKAADRFATKKERSKRRSRSNALSLEDDLQGLSLEDDLDLSATMMARARTGKTDVSLAGRLTKWAEETKELITNPTPIQITYGVIFGASVAFLFVIGLVAFSLGAVRLRGDGLDVERRRQMTMQDPFILQRAQMMDFKKRAMEVDDIRELSFNPPAPEEAPPPAPAVAPPPAPEAAPAPAPVPEAAPPPILEAAPQ